MLLGINLVSYLDRQVLYALLPAIQSDLALTDAQAGRLASAFMLVYMLAAPPIGWLADVWGRRFWISAGIALWSAATAASGLARGYGQLFTARALVGVGESCYGAVSPSFVAEFYPPEKRGRALALFSMAIPVGSALGYIAGGAIGQAWGWRNAFFLVGLPGLALSWLAWRLPDPPRGKAGPSLPLENWKGALSGYLALFKIRSFAHITLAGAAMTFALGGFAVWMPSYFHRQWGLSLGTAGTLFGGVTVLAGVAGSLCGGWLSDWALKRTSRAYLMVSGAGLFLGMPFAALAIAAPSFATAAVFLFIAEFFLFLNMGPLNAAIVSVTETNVRSMAFAANIFVIHALGDAVSPALIGSASDRWGLKLALQGTCLFLGLAAAFCAAGLKHYDADARRVKNV